MIAAAMLPVREENVVSCVADGLRSQHIWNRIEPGIADV